jgi:cytoskeletal protein RodZ
MVCLEGRTALMSTIAKTMLVVVLGLLGVLLWNFYVNFQVRP